MPTPRPTPFLPPAASARWVWGIFGLGLLLSALLIARQQVGGDQLNLLARGWLLATEGPRGGSPASWWGSPSSSGGTSGRRAW